MSTLEKILSEIKKMKRNQNSTNQDYVTEYMSALSTGEGIIAEMHDGWIPVEERLPERFTVVLASFDNGDVETLWQCWREDKEELKYFELGDEGRDGGIKNVIAWQPLPEPYKLHDHGNHTSAMEERERFFTEGEPIYERT